MKGKGRGGRKDVQSAQSQAQQSQAVVDYKLGIVAANAREQERIRNR